MLDLKHVGSWSICVRAAKKSFHGLALTCVEERYTRPLVCWILLKQNISSSRAVRSLSLSAFTVDSMFVQVGSCITKSLFLLSMTEPAATHTFTYQTSNAGLRASHIGRYLRSRILPIPDNEGLRSQETTALLNRQKSLELYIPIMFGGDVLNGGVVMTIEKSYGTLQTAIFTSTGRALI